ncbi:hypothetical protein LGH82_01990 [Mesorhizobium sp. PAMC28654]|uniref:hypothetical protein n=1 Tax=Mesorhizobium sp. PAMC28654 TaxID=2880934 RepID=UPI001D0B032C|nr:hypothetical protein [Mesorhizobium sp. PAMC28654]UDL90191.1 hypothetical protein LGH82_01990 [Mesorhizobium sp. PAMC28654]
MTVDQINGKASGMVIFGWFVGLAYYNWFSRSPISVPIWAHIVLIVVGMFAASIIIGGGLALIAAGITKAVTGSAQGSPHAFSWAAFIGLILAFFPAGYALEMFKSYTVQTAAADHLSFTCKQPLPEFTLGEKSNPTSDQLTHFCDCVWSKFPDGGWEQETSKKIRAGEDPGWRGRAFNQRFSTAFEDCGAYSL